MRAGRIGNPTYIAANVPFDASSAILYLLPYWRSLRFACPEGEQTANLPSIRKVNRLPIVFAGDGEVQVSVAGVDQ